MLEIKIINVVLFIAVLLSIYTFIFQYKTKDKVVVRAKIINKELLNYKFGIILLVICLIIGISSILLLLYSAIEEFHGTKSFRDEYEIKLSEAINDDKIEDLVRELEGKNNEWGEWALGNIRQSKTLLSYVINMLCFIGLFPIIGRIRIENHGIRRFIFLTRWNEYTSYFWKDDEITLLAIKNKTDIKVRIDLQEKDAFNRFLDEKTNLIKLNK